MNRSVSKFTQIVEHKLTLSQQQGKRMACDNCLCDCKCVFFCSLALPCAGDGKELAWKIVFKFYSTHSHGRQFFFRGEEGGEM
jgi:hypothetical protein